MKFLRWIKSNIDSSKENDSAKLEEEKKYILWVTTKYDKGYGSHWHGWPMSLMFTYDEAVKEKERIKDRYYDVEIVKVK